MNDQSNAPISSSPGGVAGWFSTWMTAITKPNEQTFATLAEHPDAASNGRAFTWVFIAGTVSALISGVFAAVLNLAGFASSSPLDAIGGGASRGVAFSFGVAICGSPIAGALGVLFFAVFVGIVQWVAKMFKGTGTFSQLAYTMAAVTVPFTLISSLLTPFSAIPIVGICTGLVSLLLGLYALVLELMAVKGVNKFGYGQAIGSLFLPGLLIACCVFAVIAGLAAMGVAVGETFNQINNNLP